jgi:putative chitobiose transport system permease protein
MKRLWQMGLLLGLVLIAIGPFLWLLSTALKGPAENIFAYPPRFLPEQFTWENFAAVWQAVPMDRYLLNSLGVSVLGVALTVVISVLTAYPLARMRFRGQGALFSVVLATMMVPFQVLMVPLFLIVLQLGLTEGHGLLPTWLGLIAPFAVSGFGIFFVRQAMVRLPKDLEEAAILDGCHSGQILRHVWLPLLTPTLSTLAVLSFLTLWSEYLWPSVLLSQPEHFTLPVGLVQLQGQFSANWRLIAAGTVLSMVPVLVLFVMMQKTLLAGSLAGSVKE